MALTSASITVHVTLVVQNLGTVHLDLSSDGRRHGLILTKFVFISSQVRTQTPHYAIRTTRSDVVMTMDGLELALVRRSEARV